MVQLKSYGRVKPNSYIICLRMGRQQRKSIYKATVVDNKGNVLTYMVATKNTFNDRHYGYPQG